MEITLYSATWCNNCKAVKQKLEGTEHVLIDLDTPEGALKASKNEVKGLPTLFLGDERYTGLQACMEALDVKPS